MAKDITELLLLCKVVTSLHPYELATDSQYVTLMCMLTFGGPGSVC